jgi:D-arabinose 1-dehydrogenase-like Zn-dependent alcohol dehydrogenase
MPWLGYACGCCNYCVDGWETLCHEQEMMGYTINGGFGEYAAAYARYVVKVPEGINPFDAAPLTCAGVTTYKAVKVSGARSSDLIAVFGIGGLGHLAVQYARISGASVAAVDIENNKLDLARQLGAEHTVNARTGDPVAAHPGPRWRRRSDLSRRLTPGHAPGIRLAQARRPPGSRRTATRPAEQAGTGRDNEQHACHDRVPSHGPHCSITHRS